MATLYTYGTDDGDDEDAGVRMTRPAVDQRPTSTALRSCKLSMHRRNSAVSARRRLSTAVESARRRGRRRPRHLSSSEILLYFST